jgi:hypothetical protein
MERVCACSVCREEERGRGGRGEVYIHSHVAGRRGLVSIVECDDDDDDDDDDEVQHCW